MWCRSGWWVCFCFLLVIWLVLSFWSSTFSVWLICCLLMRWVWLNSTCGETSAWPRPIPLLPPWAAFASSTSLPSSSFGTPTLSSCYHPQSLFYVSPPKTLSLDVPAGGGGPIAAPCRPPLHFATGFFAVLRFHPTSESEFKSCPWIWTHDWSRLSCPSDHYISSKKNWNRNKLNSAVFFLSLGRYGCVKTWTGHILFQSIV
jgi:hypothetical protein